MRVVMLASEAHPYAKTGGLADVVAALPRALTADGIEVTVCIPAYKSVLRAIGPTAPGLRLRVPLSSRMEVAEIVRVPGAAVPTVLVRADRYFDRDGLYGTPAGNHPDNAERFAFFCRAVLEWLRTLDPPPDVLHVHDWQAALAPAFLTATRTLYPELARVRTLLTIHNLGYQGRFWALDWHLLNLDARYLSPEFLEFYGDINYLKAGIVFASGITTVSPRYAQEIQTPAFGEGLDGVLRHRARVLHGILNGVDYAEWNPAADGYLPVRYDLDDLRGKSECKRVLQAELGLAVAAAPPLLVMISRFAEQKGMDVLLAGLPTLMTETDAQVGILGNGDPQYEERVRALAAAWPGRISARIGFDERLAHRLEAGGDVFLMPSRYEPCGLNQLYSLRYGTLPVVHATGGLDDTVIDADDLPSRGTGFKFNDYSAPAFVTAVRRALVARDDAERWRRLVRNAMVQDFSWRRSAQAYARLYASLPAPPAPPF